MSITISALFLFQDSMPNSAGNNIWVAIVIILFALSLISERIANLIKLQIPFLRERSQDRLTEKKREKWMMWIAVFSGLLVALLTKADLFFLIENGKLFKLNPSEGFNEKLSELNPSINVIGIILSALFISLGSKFWHDVLDIVLQLSNLRKYKVLEEGMQLREVHQDQSKRKRKDLAQKVKNITPKLQAMEGYSGFKIAAYDDGRMVAQILFSRVVPTSEDWIWINNFLHGEAELLITPEAELYDH